MGLGVAGGEYGLRPRLSLAKSGILKFEAQICIKTKSLAHQLLQDNISFFLLLFSAFLLAGQVHLLAGDVHRPAEG